jgi:hypothetical protein
MSFESMQEELCQSGRDAMKADGVKSLAEAWEKCPRVDWMWAMLKATGKRDSVPKRPGSCSHAWACAVVGTGAVVDFERDWILIILLNRNQPRAFHIFDCIINCVQGRPRK